MVLYCCTMMLYSSVILSYFSVVLLYLLYNDPDSYYENESSYDSGEILSEVYTAV